MNPSDLNPRGTRRKHFQDPIPPLFRSRTCCEKHVLAQSLIPVLYATETWVWIWVWVRVWFRVRVRVSGVIESNYQLIVQPNFRFLNMRSVHDEPPKFDSEMIGVEMWTRSAFRLYVGAGQARRTIIYKACLSVECFSSSDQRARAFQDPACNTSQEKKPQR